MADVIHTTEGVGAPQEAPTSMHQHYIDTSNSEYIYFYVGTSSVADWVKLRTGEPVEAPDKASSAEIVEGTDDDKFTTPAGLKAAGIVPGGGGGGGGAELAIGQVVVSMQDLTSPSMVEVTKGGLVDSLTRSYLESFSEDSYYAAQPAYIPVQLFTGLQDLAYGERQGVATYLVRGDMGTGENLYISEDAGVTWTVVPSTAGYSWEILGATNSGGADFLLAAAYNETSGAHELHMYSLSYGTWGTIPLPTLGGYITSMAGDNSGIVITTSNHIWWNTNPENDPNAEYWSSLDIAVEYPEMGSASTRNIVRMDNGKFYVAMSNGDILIFRPEGSNSRMEAPSSGPGALYRLFYNPSANVVLAINDSSTKEAYLAFTWTEPLTWDHVPYDGGASIEGVAIADSEFHIFFGNGTFKVLDAYDGKYIDRGVIPEFYSAFFNVYKAGGSNGSGAMIIQDTDDAYAVLSNTYSAAAYPIARYSVSPGYRAFMYLPTDS